ncbi:MAG: rhodanese-like domain-containing protein [Proteobacteria bacterium]|nr:rhodanese-like domain-containing protein [Pseudomonadota bacterium]MBU1716904.1 rhodanese-like domain-containing protein [Pseudomonadota bacterium]
MKNLFHFLLILIIVLSVSCSQDKKSSGLNTAAAAETNTSQPAKQPSKIFQTVTPTEAQKLIASRKDLLLIDVRNPEELREGFIEGSQLVPFWNIAKGQVTLPSDRPILLICAIGGRSLGIGQLLSGKGYPEIYNLKGGISAWKNEGLPLKYN